MTRSCLTRSGSSCARDAGGFPRSCWSCRRCSAARSAWSIAVSSSRRSSAPRSAVAGVRIWSAGRRSSWSASFRAASFRRQSQAIAAHARAGDHLVLLSASTDLYVPAIAQALGFQRSHLHRPALGRRPARRHADDSQPEGRGESALRGGIAGAVLGHVRGGLWQCRERYRAPEARRARRTGQRLCGRAARGRACGNHRCTEWR